MELDDLRYFRAVAMTGSFARGARSVHVSPPAVSKAVKRLEQEIGHVLFERTTRRVQLTEAGRLLSERCQRVFAELEDLEAALGRRDVRPRGELRIGAMEVFSVQLLPRALAKLVKAHPDVVPLVFEMIPERMIRALQEDRLDLALTIGARASPGIQIRSLGRSRGVLVCGRGHPLYRRGRVSARDLERHPSVVPRFWDAEQLPPLDQFPEERYARKVGATIELLQMEIELAKSGAYLAFLPEISVAEELQDRSLKALRGLDLDTRFELQLLTSTRPPKPAATVLIAAAQRELAPDHRHRNVRS
jgi:DNA-binding transcriptional LysR family regulator